MTHYDPAIVGQFSESVPPLDLWSLFDTIDCPLMLLHGAQSDVLTAGIVEQMREHKPQMHVLTFDECGHAWPASSTPHRPDRGVSKRGLNSLATPCPGEIG
ncbi:alpha/beta fold hydrolase [Salinisphaera orenii]|uniref:alpha/beta fold hydrolase n=1 Tax=Salinisphaera orenii TaxID=856731 RepID=UPI0013A65696